MGGMGPAELDWIRHTPVTGWIFTRTANLIGKDSHLPVHAAGFSAWVRGNSSYTGWVKSLRRVTGVNDPTHRTVRYYSFIASWF